MTLDPRLLPSDTFVRRHLGPTDAEVDAMLQSLGVESLDALMDQTIPSSIRLGQKLGLGAPRGEHELLAELREIAERNVVARSLIGMGYYDTIVPPVIQRNILENPGWYTQYTPYQAEIAQGRLEALLNFQTMVADLCGLPLANASLLDEATAAAEGMAMAWAIVRRKKKGFFIAEDCHPQTIAVVQTRAEPLGIVVHVGDPSDADFAGQDLFGLLLQVPATDGRIRDYAELTVAAHANKCTVIAATDLLALTVMTPPGEWGADIVVGNSQRFGVPLGYGGPHAAFMATHDEHVRKMPGRLIGVSIDAQGVPGYRLAVQTREQHIRRDRATSNICTAQVLLAIMASMYGVYHGPDGLRRIAGRVHAWTALLAEGLRRSGHGVAHADFFDTLRITPAHGDPVAEALTRGINLRRFDNGDVGIALDEKTDLQEVVSLLAIFGGKTPSVDDLLDVDTSMGAFARESDFLTHPVFNSYHAEHEMLRYLYRLQQRDLSLATSMIPLGSCTMKLNGTVEMVPITWPEFAGLHPFVPLDQAQGYAHLFDTLEAWLAEITGFDAVSLQPNAGSQGEYTGLLVIRAYHRSRNQADRDVCLIPTSAHGTNPASAVMAGMRVVTVACDEAGNIDVDDLRAQAEKHSERLAALMITYPSTHGVFESAVREICSVVHEHGGQVYMDGANMNAQVGFTNPAGIGADVCHLNLHKTFCIPHGGGGPGMGPIGVVAHLAPFLPGHPVVPCGGEQAIGPVSAAPWGSPAILPISWVYIALMGESGLAKATSVAVLNANYMARQLRGHYDILYTGLNGRVAHEFIVDCRMFKAQGVSVDDIAKRLIDYGFHAPTMSFPVPGTLMIEPTESEAKGELDRFCDAMIRIREEIRDVEEGRVPPGASPLNHAPHTAAVVSGDSWDRAYGREQAAFPAPWVRERKFWPAVGRVDNTWGDRNLMCTCPPLEAYTD